MTVPRRLIFHIGTEKTGTTSIQEMLARNQAALARQGFHVATCLGGPNHKYLAIYAGSEAATRDLCAGVPGGRAAVQATLPARLRAEVEALPPHIYTVIFSGEHCHGRLASAAEIRRLQDLTTPLFAAVTILVYLRRQDEVAVSLYSTRLRGERFDRAAILPETDPLPERVRLYFDYHALVSAWAGVFGHEAMRVRLFEPASLLGGDAVRDFAAACGFDAAALAPTPLRNRSLNAVAQELLRRIAARRRQMPAAAPPRPSLLPFLGADSLGPPRLPGRAAAARFLARFAESNERLRAAFFPDRPSLFSEDLGRYPETETLPAEAEVLEAGIAMILGLSEEVRRLNAALAVGRGELALARDGDAAEAALQFRLALAFRPGEETALRALAALGEEPDAAGADQPGR